MCSIKRNSNQGPAPGLGRAAQIEVARVERGSTIRRDTDALGARRPRRLISVFADALSGEAHPGSQPAQVDRDQPDALPQAQRLDDFFTCGKSHVFAR